MRSPSTVRADFVIESLGFLAQHQVALTDFWILLSSLYPVFEVTSTLIYQRVWASKDYASTAHDLSDPLLKYE